MDDFTTMSYRAAHKIVSRERGAAKKRSCVDCGKPARQWSYDHTDPGELVSPDGREYSLDASYYQPRCYLCHKKFDGQHRRAGVPQLHAVAAELEPQIREAIRQRREAVKRFDLVAIDEWDEELERLTAPLKATSYLPLRKVITEAS